MTCLLTCLHRNESTDTFSTMPLHTVFGYFFSIPARAILARISASADFEPPLMELPNKALLFSAHSEVGMNSTSPLNFGTTSTLLGK